MTLKPIPGAPTGAPRPEFPTGEPNPVAVPISQIIGRPVDPSPLSLPLPGSKPPLAPARRSGPVEIRGTGDIKLTFRIIPEAPAINRASMTISITGEPMGDYSPRMMPHFDLATDEAKVFLLALRDGVAPVVIADSRTALQLEFVVAEDGPAFIVNKPGEDRMARRFNAGLGFDVKAMAAQLLADLGP